MFDIEKAYLITNIVSAVLLSISVTFTLITIYKGSKSQFAYLLIAFTTAYTIYDRSHPWVFQVPIVGLIISKGT